ARPQPQPAAPVITFETAIPVDVLPPLPAVVVGPQPESEADFSVAIWDVEDAGAGAALSGEPVIEAAELEAFLTSAPESPVPPVEAPAPAVTDGVTVDGVAAAPTDGDPFRGAWDAVRDANIRPYADWRPSVPVSLPVMPRAPIQPQNNGGGGGGGHGGRPQQQFVPGGGHKHGDGGGGANRQKGRRRRRGGNDRGHDRNDRGRSRDRERGPRLPGFYNPGGD
ncbi:MAG TPA: hypothetical protein VHU40_07565, partial [Polyangia bacterium]|nr:hypothetical protein [Polyangia bacterium]